MVVQVFDVPIEGIGRRDYSQAVEVATASSWRGHQRRVSWGGSYTLPTPVFGLVYITYLPFDVSIEDPLGLFAPATPYYFMSLTVSSIQDALTCVFFANFATWDDVLIFNYDEWFGEIYGYGKASLEYSKGVKTKEGRIYVLGFCTYPESATFTAEFSVHGLQEEVVYG